MAAWNKLWAQDAPAEIRLFESRLSLIEQRARRPAGFRRKWSGAAADGEAQAIGAAVRCLLGHAEFAVEGRSPRYRPLLSWW